MHVRVSSAMATWIHAHAFPCLCLSMRLDVHLMDATGCTRLLLQLALDIAPQVTPTHGDLWHTPCPSSAHAKHTTQSTPTTHTLLHVEEE